jgi:hypothetical protein
MTWAGHVACMDEKRNAYVALMGKHEGNRPLEDLNIDWGGG